MQRLNIKQDTPEWLEFRKNHIGASDAPIIMRDSPWTTPYQLWQEKTALALKEKKMTPAMKRGKELEPMARQKFIEKTGIEVVDVVCQHDSLSWMGASMDGLSSDNKTAVELKCSNAVDHLGAVNKMVPVKYRAQLQHQMYVLELDHMYYGSFDGSDLALVIVDRDEKYLKELLLKEKEFWKRIEDFQSPEMVAADKKINYRNDPLWIETAEKYQKCLEASQEMDILRQQLIEMCEDNDITEGAGIKVTRRTEKGRIIYSKIPEIANLDLDKYRSTPITKHIIGAL